MPNGCENCPDLILETNYQAIFSQDVSNIDIITNGTASLQNAVDIMREIVLNYYPVFK